MKKTFYTILIIITLSILLRQESCFCADSAEKQKLFIGSSASPLPEWYAVIKDIKSKKNLLCKEGTYVNNEFKICWIDDNYLLIRPYDINNIIFLIPGTKYKGLEFIRPIKLSCFKYWYSIKDDGPAGNAANTIFELDEIESDTAILIRDYKEEQLLTNYVPETEALVKIDLLKQVEYSDPVELFLEQVQMKRMGTDTWIIDGKSVSKPVVKKTAKALAKTAANIMAAGFRTNGSKSKFQISSKICTGVLDQGGFSADTLGPALRDKAGFMAGDVIRSINGKRVTSMLGLILLFMDIKKDNVSTVTVEIFRNNQPRMLTYVIK